MQTADESRRSESHGMMAPGQASYSYNPLYAGQMGYAMPQSYPAYGQYKQGHGHQMDDLTNAFAGMKPAMIGGHNAGYAPQAPLQAPVYYRLHDSTMLHRATAPQPYHGASYMMPPPGPYNVPSTPGHYGWNGVPQEHAEVPGLARRNSVSSNEEVGPQTPFFAGQLGVDQYKRSMAVNGESPQAWSTPSPYSLSYGPSQLPQQLMKVEGQYKNVDFDKICSEEPPIPKPVPAIFSSEKSRGTLDKCLKNETNTTNVYIRGLHPDTSDDMLNAYGSRFGSIMSAKSMLDQGTGLCKGFGFIKYHNFDDGENCIRGFFHMGYEAKWARVSHNERLKTLGDENNTNLYISNLPMTYNEQMLMSIFTGYEVMSSKILRDENGISRGVSFARFALPEICMEIIQKFNGHPLPEGLTLSIRFADTPDQKKLKNLTAERRQFKTHEYNTAAFGPGSPYASSVSPVTATVPSPVQTRFVPGSVYNPAQASPIYASYGGAAYSAGGSLPSATRVAGTGESSGSETLVKSESPSVAAHAKRSSVAISKESSKYSTEDAEEDDENALQSITNASCRPDMKFSPTKTPSKATSPVKNSPSKGGVKTTPSKASRARV